MVCFHSTLQCTERIFHRTNTGVWEIFVTPQGTITNPRLTCLERLGRSSSCLWIEVAVHTSSKFGKSFCVKFLIYLQLHKFAFLRTWLFFYVCLEKGHVLRNANYCIQKQIKNFTHNKSRNKNSFFFHSSQLFIPILHWYDFVLIFNANKWILCTEMQYFSQKIIR